MIFLPVRIIAYQNIFNWCQLSSGVFNRYNQRNFSIGAADVSTVAKRLLYKIFVHINKNILCPDKLTEKNNRRKIAGRRNNRFRHAALMDDVKQPAPAYFIEEASLRIPRHPDKNGLTYNMVFGNKTPVTRVG